MTLLVDESFEGAAAGTTISTTNSVFDNVVGSPTFSTSHVLASGGGTRMGKFAASTSIVTARADMTATAVAKVSAYLYVETAPGSNTSILHLTSAGTMRAEMQLSGSTVRIRNSASVAIATSPSGTIPLATDCRLEWEYDNGAGTQRLRVYSGANVHGTTPDYDSGTVSTGTAGTVDRVVIGSITSSTSTTHWDNLRVDNATMPAPTGNVAPTADAGPDQTVEPGVTVTLSGTPADSDGTIVSRTWAQTGGTSSPRLWNTNLITDQDKSTFDTSQSMVNAANSGNAIVAWSAEGGGVLRWEIIATGAAISMGTHGTGAAVTRPAVTVGRNYKAECDVAQPVGATLRTAAIDIQWIDASNSIISTQAGGVTTITRDWKHLAVNGDAPAGAVTARVRIRLTTYGIGDVIFWNDIQLFETDGTDAVTFFAAPTTLTGDVLTFEYTVTDDDGATASDTCTVTVLPVTERAVIGGVEVPMYVREV